MMHVPINVKSRNNTNKWQMGFNSASKGLKREIQFDCTGSRSIIPNSNLRVHIVIVKG
jgi:hypothetical protein